MAAIRAFVVLMVMVGVSACQTAPPANHLTEAQVSALRQEGFARTEEGWEFSASDKLLFGYDEYVLQSEARAAVDRVARILTQVPGLRLRVDGHADAIGSEAYNNQLSARRAQVVADALVAGGIPAEAIAVRGLGKSKPIASNQTAEGRQQNRRVAIVINTD